MASMSWANAIIVLFLAIFGCGQVQFTIDTKYDNSFYHELMSPSISSSNARQNIYSRYGSSVSMSSDVAVVGADNNGDCTLDSNKCNLVNTASVTSCNSDGVFSCGSESDCWFRVGSKLYFEKDGSSDTFCGVTVGMVYFVLESNGFTFTVSKCDPLSVTPTKKACAAEAARYTPGASPTSGFMIASSHSGEGAAFIFERNLHPVTNPNVYASMLDSPPAASFSDLDCVPQYVTVVVVSSATSDDTFTISTKPERFGCNYCVVTTANFVVGRPVYFSAVKYFGGVATVVEGQPVFFGNFIVGMVYKIVTAGVDPRFTSIGASDNNIGTTFLATGTGASEMGTGSAIMQPYTIHSQSSTTTFSIRKMGSTLADLVTSPLGSGVMTATTSIETCVPVKNAWGFRRQLMAPEEEQQFVQTNIPINKQGDRFGASVWVDEDPSMVNNPVVIVGAPMKKLDNPTEFIITAIKSEHFSYYRPNNQPELKSYKFKHVFMCNDCQVYVGDRVVFTGAMPTECVPPETGTFGSRVGVSVNRIYYVVGVVRKFRPDDTSAPEGFQLAYSLDGVKVVHPNEKDGSGGGEDEFTPSDNTAIVTVGTCAYGDGKTALTSTAPDGLDPLPPPQTQYVYDQATGALQGPKPVGCACASPNLKMKIVRVNAAGGAYIWEKSGGVWIFKSRLSIPGPYTPLVQNVLWEKSYFGAAVSVSAKHKLAFVGCPGCTAMKGRFRQGSTGALWVFAPIAGNWNAMGHQKLSYSNINGKFGTEFGNALAYSATFSILAVAAFNDQSEKVPLYQDYNLKGHGSVYLFTRQNTNPPVDATTPHNQFIFAAKLTSVDSSYVEYQRNHFGRMLYFDDRTLYVGAGRSRLDKVYVFTYSTGSSFNLHKIYLTDTAQWYENTAFANPTGNPTAMITTQAGCNTGKCDDSRDLNRPTFYDLPFCSDGENAVVGNVNLDKTGSAFITSKELVTIFHTPICMTFATPWQWEYNFPNAG